MLYESLCPSPLGARRGKGALLASARFYWTRCDMRRSGEDALKSDGPLRILTNVSHSSLLVLHTAAQSTSKSPTTSTTAGRMQAGRMQAEKHRSALRTGPIQASGLTEAASWDSSGSLGTTTTVRVSPSRIG